MAEKTLYDSNAIMYVLGVIMRQPDIIHQNGYILSTTDFEGLHEILFGAMYNLSVEGSITLTPGQVDLYLRQFTKQYEIYTKTNGYEYLQRLNTLVDINFDKSQFDYYYNRVKKFTILRDFSRSGIDIREFYNPDADFLKIDEENEKLNNLEVKQIFDRIRERIANVEDKNISKANVKAIPVGQGLQELVEELSVHPEVGYPLDGEILNFSTRGARLGKYYLYSAPTGHGKTRFMVGNACALSMPYIKDGKIIIRDHLRPILFIATEMEPDEIQTLVLAYVSGINEDKILNATYSPEEKKIIQIAIRLIQDYSENFRIEKISDPNISLVRSKIIKYILSDKIYNIFYDYIFTTPSLNMEFSRTGLREDVTLMMLSNTLKELAADYNVFIMSGTQVNRGWEKRQFRNENNIAGSKAIADKADFGMIALKLLDTELEEIATYLKELDLPIPNVVIDIYKNRRGKIVNAKLFRIFDYGTCRAIDVLLTDTNYNVMHNLGKIEYTYKVKDLLEVIVDKHNKKKDDDDEGGDK